MIIKRRTARGKLRYGVRVDRGGRQKWVGTFDTLAEARKQEAKAKASRRLGSMRCDEFVDHFLEGYKAKVKASSYDTAETALRLFKSEYRGIALDQVTEIEAQRWARKNRWRVPVIVTLFNAARKAKLVDDNPFAGIVSKGEGRKNTPPLTVAEVEALGQAALEAHGEYGPMMRALLLFLAYSGMRVGEAFVLEWTDLDVEAMRIRVERRVYRGELDTPKSGKRRLIVLTPQARDAILGLDRSSRTIFTAKRGGQLSQSLLTWYMEKVNGRFGRDVEPHELKHFAGHYLYVVLGLPARVVAVQLGHNDGGRLVEQLYGHGDVGALEEIDRALERNVIPIRKASGE